MQILITMRSAVLSMLQIPCVLFTVTCYHFDICWPNKTGCCLPNCNKASLAIQPPPPAPAPPLPPRKTTWCGQTLNWGIRWHIMVMWMKRQKACDLNVTCITSRYSIVNIQIFSMEGIRSQMIKNISVMSTSTLRPGPWKSYPQMC